MRFFFKHSQDNLKQALNDLENIILNLGMQRENVGPQSPEVQYKTI